MPGPKPQVERERHFHAYEVYRDLGYGRTFREVSRQVHASVVSVSKWSRWFDWPGRIAEYSTTVVEREEEASNLLKSDDPIARKLIRIMERMEALIDSAFVREESGKLSLKTIKVKDVEDLAKFVEAYRKYLETYFRFVEKYQPLDKAKKKDINIKEFNVNMGNISQEDRIAVMKGLVNGNVPRGDRQPTGRAQDADYTDISESGDEDGLGRDGVPGSPASGSGGDETPVRES